MGTNEETKSSKTEKPSTPAAPDAANIHVYPDWAAMQAYYGPRVALPPYYNSAVSSGHTPHTYMWSPAQPMMPPYGAPYAAVYPHGGIYGHPAVPLSSNPHGHGFPTSPPGANPSSLEASKPSGNNERGLMKKLKSFDGLAMSIGNGSADGAEDGAEQKQSQSSETEGSSDGTSSGADENRRKRSREDSPLSGNGKPETAGKPAGNENASDKVLGTSAGHQSVTNRFGGPILSPSMSTASLELRNPPIMNAKANSTGIPQPGSVMPSDAWLQNERELKRERRKQSNRESARRSRLRKQAETEELAKKVESLISDNMALKSEISRLTENSEKLRQENTALMDKLDNLQPTKKEDGILNKFDENDGPLHLSTENLLSRVNNAGSIDRASEGEGETYKRNSNSGTKLHQLLDSKPRTDAVAAG